MASGEERRKEGSGMLLKEEYCQRREKKEKNISSNANIAYIEKAINKATRIDIAWRNIRKECSVSKGTGEKERNRRIISGHHRHLV